MFQVLELRVAIDGTEEDIRERLSRSSLQITRQLETNLVGHGFVPLRLMGANSIMPRLRSKQLHEEPQQLSFGLRGDQP